MLYLILDISYIEINIMYTNKNGQSLQDSKSIVYTLNKEFGATQSNIGAALGCSQSTVSNWIKEINTNNLISEYKEYISNLKSEMRQNVQDQEHMNALNDINHAQHIEYLNAGFD